MVSGFHRIRNRQSYYLGYNARFFSGVATVASGDDAHAEAAPTQEASNWPATSFREVSASEFGDSHKDRQAPGILEAFQMERLEFHSSESTTGEQYDLWPER